MIIRVQNPNCASRSNDPRLSSGSDSRLSKWCRQYCLFKQLTKRFLKCGQIRIFLNIVDAFLRHLWSFRFIIILLLIEKLKMMEPKPELTRPDHTSFGTWLYLYKKSFICDPCIHLLSRLSVFQVILYDSLFESKGWRLINGPTCFPLFRTRPNTLETPC